MRRRRDRVPNEFPLAASAPHTRHSAEPQDIRPIGIPKDVSRAAGFPRKWGIGLPAKRGIVGPRARADHRGARGISKGEESTMTRLRTLTIQLVLFGTLVLASGFGGKGWKW